MSVFADRQTIDLASLNRGGALLRRCDTKFVLDGRGFTLAVASVGEDLLVLSHLGRTETEYETVYHDDSARRSFRDHAQGRRRRFKVRTRRYGRNGPTMLEVKLKMPHGQTDKVRWDIGDHDPRRPLTDAHLQLVNDAIVARYGFGLGSPLRPVASVGFSRTTLFLPDARERLTVDSRIVLAAIGDDTSQVVCDPNAHVAEVKSPRRRSEIVRRLARVGVRPAPISKYGVAIATLEDVACPARWRAAIRVLAPEAPVRV